MGELSRMVLYASSHNHLNFSELQTFTNCCCCYEAKRNAVIVYVEEGEGLHVFWHSDKVFSLFFHLFLQNNNHLWLSKEKLDKKEFYSFSDLQMDLRDKVSNYRTTDREGSYTFKSSTQCLKIIEKVSFNIASEASYVYISEDKS